MTAIIGGRGCGSCEHRLRVGAMIVCRRYPPQMMVIPMQQPNGQVVPGLQSNFPVVSADMICGEYRRSELHAAEEVGAAASDVTGMARQ